MTKVSKLHKRWSKDPEYRTAYGSMQAEFELAKQLISTRLKSGMSQGELAEKMGTSQSSIARLESGNSLPSLRTLIKFAQATNSEFRISFRSITRV